MTKPDGSFETDPITDAIELRGIGGGYPRGPRIIDDLTAQIEDGSFVAVVGPNGCGKSTLLRIIAKLLPPTAGTVILRGRDISERSARELARELGMLPQSNIAPEGMRVVDLIARGRFPHGAPFARWSTIDEAAVAAAMHATAVTDLASRDVDALSGGQRQTVWLAMALAQDTPVLLLDEPTTFLDIAHQIDMRELFRRVNREQNRTVIAVLHDLGHAARYADRIIAMRDGKILLDGAPTDILTAESVEAVFDLPCRVIPDPDTGTPLVLPRTRST